MPASTKFPWSPTIENRASCTSLRELSPVSRSDICWGSEGEVNFRNETEIGGIGIG